MNSFDPSVRDYLNQVANCPVLSREEERELFQRLETGDEKARERLIECNLKFVVKIALHYRGQGIPVADMIQEGNIGLLEVLNKFDWRKGFRFSTYAAFWIREAIQQAIRRQGNLIRLPVRKARLMGKIAETIRRLREEGIPDPTPRQIAEERGLTEEQVVELMRLRESVLSLDQDRDGEGHTIADTLPAKNIEHPSQSIQAREVRFHVGKVLDFLSAREREVVRLRFGFTTGRSLSLRKTSRVVGLSQEGVRRIERRAIEKLQRPVIQQRVAALI